MRQTVKTNKASILMGLCIGAFVTLQVSSAQATTWNFCTDPKRTEIEVNTPAAMIMLDRSGSMRTNKSGSQSLWNVAKNSLQAVVGDLTSTNPDQVLFGLGLFPKRGTNFEGEIVFEAKENALASMNAILNLSESSIANGGYTPMRHGIDVTSASLTLNDPVRPSAGVLITDGVPNGTGSSQAETVTAACNMRNSGKSLYVVGLGGGTDKRFNDKLAAAAGKGCCGTGANSTCSNGIGTDPCTNPSIDKNTCYGSYEAHNQTEFTNVLLGIAHEISCTFDLDVSLHPTNQAPDNPEAVIVRMQAASGLLSIPHRTMNSSMTGEGWFFSNENRNSVTLTPHYCGMIQSGDAEFVDTQVACPCVQEIGTACDVPGQLPPLVCPAGTWSCDSGFDVCVPLALEICPVACPGYDLGAPCHMDDQPVSINGQGAHDPLKERNRCKIGEVACLNNTTPYCHQLFGPMPELCDGLDNDCDGVVDNIVASWDKEAFATFEIPSDHDNAAAACFQRDACVCGTTMTSFNHYAPIMTPANAAAEYALYLESWSPEFCECREGLSQ